MLIARFDGDVERLKQAYDDAHRLIMDRGGPPGELWHHCTFDENALYIIGVWESETHLRRRLDSKEFKGPLAETGFPSFDTADVTILRLHAIEPPLKP